eukprot:gene27658-33420_t
MSHADSGQSRGNIANLFAVRAPRQCSRIADVSQSHRVGRYRRHSLEGCTQRSHDVLLDAFGRADAFVGAAAVVCLFVFCQVTVGKDIDESASPRPGFPGSGGKGPGGAARD